MVDGITQGSAQAKSCAMPRLRSPPAICVPEQEFGAMIQYEPSARETFSDGATGSTLERRDDRRTATLCTRIMATKLQLIDLNPKPWNKVWFLYKDLAS